MKKIILLGMVLFSTTFAFAQTVIVQRDPEIVKILEEISAKNIENNVRKLVSFGTRHTMSDTVSNTRGIGAARRWIKAEFDKYAKESGGRLLSEYDAFVLEPDGNRITRRSEHKNVLAILPGVDTADKRIYIVSGHYDSRASGANDEKIDAPGANDDASGTAAVMEMARVFSKYRFNATLIFVAVTGEEQGLYGAANLAKVAKEKGWNVAGFITNDIIGNTHSSETDLKDNTKLRVFSEGVPSWETGPMTLLRTQTGTENDYPARQFARYIKEIGERYVDHMEVKLIYRRDRYLRGGDHTPFANAGFTAVRLTEMNEDFNRQHQNLRKEGGVDYGDLPDFVDYNYVQKVTRINAATLANIASAPQEPQNPGLLISELTNETTLVWGTPKGKKPKGYFILMRETTSPFWEKKIYVEGNRATIPYSKDNYFFGIQSVDDKGHESLPVIPRPIRQ